MPPANRCRQPLSTRLVYKHAVFEGAAYHDISTLVRHVERGAGFEMPKTR
jgi:hypothetical protein